MVRPLAVLIVILLGSPNLYAMKRFPQGSVDPVLLVTAGILVILPALIDDSRAKKKQKTVSFVDVPIISEFEDIDGWPTGKLKRDRPKIPLKANSTDGMRKASRLHICMNEMGTTKHVFATILALEKLIREKESLETPSLDIETINQFIKLIFNGVDLTTAVSTIQNMLPEKITSAQYYSLLVNLAGFYPDPILSPFVLNKMIAQTDAELFSLLSLKDGSMLSFLVTLYQTLVDQPATGLTREILREDLTFILTQGKKQTHRFRQKIERIVELVI